jgi:hypothetical protein
VLRDATADYSDGMMHAALDINMPNYASAIATTKVFSVSPPGGCSAGATASYLSGETRGGDSFIRDVAYWHICDMLRLAQHVRNTLESGHNDQTYQGVFATIVVEEFAGLPWSQGLDQTP